MDILYQKQFKDINLNDPFFDSLKSDYPEFVDWFRRKSEEYAYVFEDSDNTIDGFLYLKPENEELDDIDEPLPKKPRLKIGTFKINSHGTRLGERFMKKSFDIAFDHEVKEIYVTLFEKQTQLIRLFEKYGFEYITTKTKGDNKELV
jgi:predicted GNAT family N-acyltransferase